MKHVLLVVAALGLPLSAGTALAQSGSDGAPPPVNKRVARPAPRVATPAHISYGAAALMVAPRIRTMRDLHPIYAPGPGYGLSRKSGNWRCAPAAVYAPGPGYRVRW